MEAKFLYSGLRLHGNTLFVMDAIFGFFTLDLNTFKLKLLVKPTDVLPSMKFPNDFDINSKGTVIYFTDSSYKYPINKIVEEVMEGTRSVFINFLRYKFKQTAQFK